MHTITIDQLKFQLSYEDLASLKKQLAEIEETNSFESIKSWKDAATRQVQNKVGSWHIAPGQIYNLSGVYKNSLPSKREAESVQAAMQLMTIAHAINEAIGEPWGESCFAVGWSTRKMALTTYKISDKFSHIHQIRFKTEEAAAHTITCMADLWEDYFMI